MGPMAVPRSTASCPTCLTTSLNRLAELDDAWSVNATGNNEGFCWLEQAVRSHHTPAYERLETFLIHVGRRKF